MTELGTRDEVEARINAHIEAGALNEATTVAIEQYGPGVLGMLVHAVSDEDSAKDIFSIWCEDVWSGIGSFQGHNKATFRTWAYRVAYNAMYRYTRTPHHKRRSNVGSHELQGRVDAQLEARIHETTQTFFKTTTKDIFKNIRAQLTEEQNMLLILRVDRGMSWQEVALVLLGEDEDPDSVDLKAESNRLRQRFHRVKEKLKRLARKEGIVP